MTSKRSRAIRAIMAETGMRYMAAMREFDRRQAVIRQDMTLEPDGTPEPGRHARTRTRAEHRS